MFSEDVKKAMCSVVTIVRYNGETPMFGSGFVIKRSGDESVIVTCEHCVCVRPNDSLYIRYVVEDSVRELPAAILFVSDTDVDVALITVDGLTALPPLRFSELNMFIGQNTVTIGNCSPDRLWEGEDDWAITKFHASCPGLVKGFRTRIEVMMKGVGLGGMSGGPTLSRKGVSAMLTGGALGCTVAITTEGIKAELGMFLAERNIQFGENSTIHEMLHMMPLRVD